MPFWHESTRLAAGLAQALCGRARPHAEPASLTTRPAYPKIVSNLSINQRIIIVLTMPTVPTTPEERFSAALHATARIWRLALDKRLKHLGIGQSGWMTIAMVAKAAEPLSQRALADEVGVEGPSMVSMLDRLERDGFVVRSPSPLDRRVKLVQLTDSGRRVYDEVRREGGAVRGLLLEGIDAGALAAATELLETLRARIEGSL